MTVPGRQPSQHDLQLLLLRHPQGLDERDKKGLTTDVIMRDVNRRLARIPGAQAFAFAPPIIPGIGTSRGVTFMVEDRAGKDPQFLAANTGRFIESFDACRSDSCEVVQPEGSRPRG
jgi:hypothetical protein